MKVINNGVSVDNVDYIIENKSQQTILSDLSRLEIAIIFCAIGSFIATVMFAVNIATNGQMDPAIWTGEQFIYVTGYIIVVAAVVAGEFFLFSSGYRGVAPLAITAVLVLFGLYTEVSLAMSREEKTVSVRSQESPTYQAALQAIGKLTSAPVSVTNPYAEQIAEQAQIVARCERRLAAGKEKHCDGDTARLDALKSQAEAAMAATASASSNAVSTALTTAKNWERDDNQHSGMIKFFATTIGISHISATFIFMLIFVGTFRLAFWFIGDQVAAHKQALKRLGMEPTRKQRQNATLVNSGLDISPSDSESEIQRSATQQPQRKTQYDTVPVSEIVRLASIQILCMIADQQLTSFAFRPVNEALTSLGYGKSDQQRRVDIYPELADHFEKEGYISQNPEWIEFAEGETNPNGKRQKWLLNVSYCKQKAEGIPRD